MDKWGIIATTSNCNNGILIYTNNDIGEVRKVAKLLYKLGDYEQGYTDKIEEEESNILETLHEKYGVQWWDEPMTGDVGYIPTLQSYTIVKLEVVK